MDSQFKYMCPRPRSSQACTHCKSRKTRCLREGPSEACQRCKTLKLQCISKPGHSTSVASQRQPPTPPQEDLISSLFGNRKPQPSTNVIDFHHQVFQNTLLASSPEERSCPQSLSNGVDHEAPRPPILDQTKADELVDKFRAKNNYFPFVTLPSDLKSPDRRFLYLAVLTAASSDDMALLRHLDGKFRAVLADRVVVAGEKSLDYLQGILVYLAWYNMHLEPKNLQIHQYLHIAICMIADLKFVDASAGSSQALSVEAKNACLGCYYLSSLMSTDTNRANNAVLSDDLRVYISQLSVGDSNERLMYTYIQTQMAVEATCKDEPSDVYPDPSDYLEDTPSITIARHFLSFQKELNPYTLHPALLKNPILPQKFHSITTTGKSFLTHFASIATPEFPKFTIAEFMRLIATIKSLIQVLCDATGLPEETILTECRQITILIECLANRMDKLSRSGRLPGEFPDMFYLFKSILDLITPLEARIPRVVEYTRSVSQGRQFKEGVCPVLMGMGRTEFWTAYKAASPLSQSPYDMGLELDALFPNYTELSAEEWIDATCTLNP